MKLVSKHTIGLFLLLISIILWALGTVFVKIALLDGIQVMPLLVVQLSLGILTVLVVIALFERTAGSSERKWWWLGILEPGMAYIVGTFGLVYVSAINAMVIMSLESFFIVLFVFLMYGNQIRITQLIAGTVMLAGALMVCLPPGADFKISSFSIGDGMLFLGVLCSALYVAFSTRLIQGNMMPARLMLYQLSGGLLFGIIVLIVADPKQLLLVPESINFWTVSSGILSFGISFVTYLYGLRFASISLSAFVLCLTPVFGLLFAYILLGEQIQSNFGWLGFIILMISIIVFITLDKVNNESE